MPHPPAPGHAFHVAEELSSDYSACPRIPAFLRLRARLPQDIDGVNDQYFGLSLNPAHCSRPQSFTNFASLPIARLL